MMPVLPAPIELRREMASQLEEVDLLCRELRSLLAGSAWREAAFAVELVARECLNNAVLHGNAGETGKWVSFGLRCAGTQIRLRVIDEGEGHTREPGLDAITPSALATSGRGFSILQAYAERVRFNRRGNQITVWLRASACCALEKI